MLSVQRDPGATVVYVGFVLLFLTLVAVFFFSHQRVWAAIEPAGTDRLMSRLAATPTVARTRLTRNSKSLLFHLGVSIMSQQVMNRRLSCRTNEQGRRLLFAWRTLYSVRTRNHGSLLLRLDGSISAAKDFISDGACMMLALAIVPDSGGVLPDEPVRTVSLCREARICGRRHSAYSLTCRAGCFAGSRRTTASCRYLTARAQVPPICPGCFATCRSRICMISASRSRSGQASRHCW